MASTRAGRYVSQPTGYRAFVPQPLPPHPPVTMDQELVRLLSDADRDLGRLDGVATVLPDPNLFVAMYVRHEAVLSSQIEGTQSTLEDLLEFEADAKLNARPKDVEEVVNYVRAMNYGLDRLKELPLSLRLIREIHQKLLEGVRGGDRSPGEFRRTQNWVGARGCTLSEAEFVPPPPHEMTQALGDFERFLHHGGDLPVLVHCGLAHAQFETIHPFLDGNGRVGRLLITFLLCQRDVLRRPLLYLSYYLKAHRAQYYDRLTAIRSDGDWEGWLNFFLRGVSESSRTATQTARDIVELRERHRSLMGTGRAADAKGLLLLDHLFHQPVLSVRTAGEVLRCSYVTAAHLVAKLVRLGILQELTGRQRNRLYRHQTYVDLFQKQALNAPEEPGSSQAPTGGPEQPRE